MKLQIVKINLANYAKIITQEIIISTFQYLLLDIIMSIDTTCIIQSILYLDTHLHTVKIRETLDKIATALTLRTH